MRPYDEVHAVLAAPAPGLAEAMAALGRVAQLRTELDAAEAALIEAARDGGAGWSAIASALGLASRQAGEQRLARLRRRITVRQQSVDDPVRNLISAVSAAAGAIAADPGWDDRHPAAALVRQCLALAAAQRPDDPPGGRYSLVDDVLNDLREWDAAALPDAPRAALDRLRSAAREARARRG
ncbi:hypothetical protein [Catenuloplanes indicus]|uniref:Uncharacterized protein n=1 Tax=Catenuloplanes indicus TaxID=137267 RepID=A0AAE4B1E2_9ACTN|nr:hypothetical protein [Catenuloplanes indicus]MDQ0370564.1 hypothetical protein [Catenuloplanes indicus]